MTANWRLVLILLVMAGLAPVTWFRTEPPLLRLDAPVIFTPVPIAQPVTGAVRIVAGWKLTSLSNHFGGYSAMLAIDGQHLIAASDRGRIMRLTLRGSGPPDARLNYLSGDVQPAKHLIDIESMTRNPATGQIWIGYEGVNAVERRDNALRQPERVRPPQMRGWSDNSGAEAMVRLADGRFIILQERARSWSRGDVEALLFAADAVDGAPASRFRFIPPEGYRPVDMVQIPDGRVLILVRDFTIGLIPRFTTKLVLADPAAIEAGGTWSGRIIAEFAPPNPSDNFEGLAVWPREDGMLDLWMISDDNRSGVQNTYLLEMRLDLRSVSAATRPVVAAG